MQTLIVAVIVAIAALCLAWRGYKTLTRSKSPCDSCAGCPLKQNDRRIKECSEKKAASKQPID